MYDRDVSMIAVRGYAFLAKFPPLMFSSPHYYRIGDAPPKDLDDVASKRMKSELLVRAFLARGTAIAKDEAVHYVTYFKVDALREVQVGEEQLRRGAAKRLCRT